MHKASPHDRYLSFSFAYREYAASHEHTREMRCVGMWKYDDVENERTQEEYENMRVAKTVVKRKKDGVVLYVYPLRKAALRTRPNSGFCGGLPFRTIARPHPPTSRRIEIY